MAKGVLQRFHEKVEIDPATKCWNWTAAKVRGGYGLFMYARKGVMAHRFAYEFFRGSIPEGRQIDHVCRNPSCVNPAHLEIVTPQENICRSGVSETARQTQLSKTHCPQGHPYSGDNLYLKPNGRRECRACVRNSGAKYRESVGRGNKRQVYEFNGQRHLLAEWAKIVGISRRILADRIRRGWPIKDVLTKPNRKGTDC